MRNEIMQLQGVIVTSDEATFHKLAGAAFGVGLKLKRMTAHEAATKLEHDKTHAVIVDCREPGTQEAIARLRMHGSNRHCVVFALAADKAMSQEAHVLGANFVLDIPLRIDAASRCLRAARGLMIAEYRRYMRIPTDAAATVVLNSGETIAVRVSNLSLGGMAIQCDPSKILPRNFSIRFALGDHKRLELSVHVAWNNARGDHGLQFTKPTPSEREAISHWVESKHVREANSGFVQRLRA
jgi:hypothetical protein